MHKILLFVFLSFALLSCQSPNWDGTYASNCEEGDVYVLIENDYCPSGYLFENDKGKKVFIDFLAYPPDQISKESFDAINIGDMVSLAYLELDTQADTFRYHLIDIVCQEPSQWPPKYDVWAKANCLDKVWVIN